MAEAMYSPKGEYKQAKTAEEVAELKKQGYMHGHEYFSMLVNPPETTFKVGDVWHSSIPELDGKVVTAIDPPMEPSKGARKSKKVKE